MLHQIHDSAVIALHLPTPWGHPILIAQLNTSEIEIDIRPHTGKRTGGASTNRQQQKRLTTEPVWIGSKQRSDHTVKAPEGTVRRGVTKHIPHNTNTILCEAGCTVIIHLFYLSPVERGCVSMSSWMKAGCSSMETPRTHGHLISLYEALRRSPGKHLRVRQYAVQGAYASTRTHPSVLISHPGITVECTTIVSKTGAVIVL